MALIHCDFRSHILQLHTSMTVILPQPAPDQDGMLAAESHRRYPVLFLLHGLSDNHTIWQRVTSIERYVSGMNLAVVMPDVHRSYYTDMASGHRYWTFVSEELPRIVRSLFPISAKREETFVAGLSMGGYGAFKLALSHPDRFAAAASLSGSLDLAANLEPRDRVWRHDLRSIFGDLKKVAGSHNDLLALADSLAASGKPQPALYQWCGTEDFLYHLNTSFRDHAERLGLDLLYEEGPGDHTWEDWDRQIQRVLEWLPLNPRDRSS